MHDTAKLPLTANVVSLAAGGTYPVWVYFPAPPTSTSSVTVAMPGGTQRVSQVPIAAAPAD